MKSLLTIAITFLTLNVWAGAGSHGGDAIVCFKDVATAQMVLERVEGNQDNPVPQDPLKGIEVESAELLDLYFARLQGKEIISSQSDPEEIVLKRLEILGEKIGYKISHISYTRNTSVDEFKPFAVESYKKYFTYDKWVQAPYGLIDVKDSGRRDIINSKCLPLQVAYQEHVGDFVEVHYDTRIYNKLSNVDQAALQLHEVLYYEYLINATAVKNPTSRKTQLAVAYIFDKELSNKTGYEVFEYFKKLKFSFTKHCQQPSAVACATNYTLTLKIGHFVDGQIQYEDLLIWNHTGEWGKPFRKVNGSWVYAGNLYEFYVYPLKENNTLSTPVGKQSLSRILLKQPLIDDKRVAMLHWIYFKEPIEYKGFMVKATFLDSNLENKQVKIKRIIISPVKHTSGFQVKGITYDQEQEVVISTDDLVKKEDLEQFRSITAHLVIDPSTTKQVSYSGESFYFSKLQNTYCEYNNILADEEEKKLFGTAGVNNETLLLYDNYQIQECLPYKNYFGHPGYDFDLNSTYSWNNLIFYNHYDRKKYTTTYYKNGNIKSATLAEDTKVGNVSCAERGQVFFSPNKTVTRCVVRAFQHSKKVYCARGAYDFYDNGHVKSCILEKNYRKGWGYKKYKKGELLPFTKDGIANPASK